MGVGDEKPCPPRPFIDHCNFLMGITLLTDQRALVLTDALVDYQCQLN